MFEGASLDVVRNRFEVVRDKVLFCFDFVFNNFEELFNRFDEFPLLVELFRVACKVVASQNSSSFSFFYFYIWLDGVRRVEYEYI